MSSLPSRPQAFSLYRRLLRAASAMPTSNRTGYVRSRTQTDFRANLEETDPTKIKELLLMGEIHLDSVDTQATHLTKQFAMPGYHTEVEPELSKFSRRRKA